MNKLFADWRGTTLYLPATLCLRDCAALRTTRMAFPAARVTVNARALNAVDSVGIAALVLLVRRARAAGVSLVWQEIGEPLRHLLTVYELNNGAFFPCRNN